MRKFLSVLLIILIFVGAVGYFGVQWKVNDSVEKVFASIPLAEASFGEAKLDVNGRLVISNIEIFVPFTGTSVDINRVSFSTSNLLETLLLEYSLKEGQLPRSAQMEIIQFAVDIDPQLLAGFSDSNQSDFYSQVVALGCGRNTVVGPKEIYDMGFTKLAFDFGAGYRYDGSTDEFSSTLDWSFDGVGEFSIDQTSVGLGRLMDDFQNAMFGFDPASVSTTDLRMQYSDLGYNKSMQEFCATRSGMLRDAWVDQHIQMVDDVLTAVNWTSDFDLLSLYKEMMTDRAQLVVDLRPLPGFSASDLQFYDIAQLAEVVNLQVSVNDTQVDIGDVSWDSDRLENVNLSSIRSNYRVASEDVEEGEQEAVAEQQSNTLERILSEVRVSDLEQYVSRTVQLTRIDGQVFSGVMTSVTADRVVVRTRYKGGFTDLPIQRAQVRVAKLYPE